VTGRRQHYAHFYGLLPLPRDGRPLLLVHGNCQAESLRVLLDGDASPVRTVRVPPVHELAAEDLPHLDRLLAEVDVLVSQPVRDGYRGLPLGTAEVLARAGRRPRSVVVPIVRWAALHPFQVIVRTPAGDPPLVPYSDLRTLTLAAGRPALPGTPSADAVRAVRALSVRELLAREERHGSVGVVDLLHAAGAAAAHTVNHPGNGVLAGVARRVLDAAGSPAEPTDPGRTLLDRVHTPVQPEVLAALGLTGGARDDWLVEGRRIPDAAVREAQLRWYADHPGVAEAGLERHAEAAAVLAA
jgi:Polysaccharide biosynthesis enzyme WcbI